MYCLIYWVQMISEWLCMTHRAHCAQMMSISFRWQHVWRCQGNGKWDGKEKLCIINNSKEFLDIATADYIIEFNSDKTYEKRKKINWRYVCNPDGTMRWLYPPNISRPWFLSFYNFNYWKAACYKTIVRVLFMMRLPKPISNGIVTIHAFKPLAVENLITVNAEENREYAIFGGTPGPNRKIILAVAEHKRISNFFKISLNNRSKGNIYNEYKTLRKLQSYILMIL